MNSEWKKMMKIFYEGLIVLITIGVFIGMAFAPSKKNGLLTNYPVLAMDSVDYPVTAVVVSNLKKDPHPSSPAKSVKAAGVKAAEESEGATLAAARSAALAEKEGAVVVKAAARGASFFSFLFRIFR